MYKLNQVFNNLIRVMNVFAMVALFVMMLLTVADVSLRYSLKMPIIGSTEIVEVLMAVLVFMAIASCTARDGHLHIDLLMSHLPMRIQSIAELINLILSLFVSFVLCWWGFLAGLSAQESNLGSSLLAIPLAPVYYVIAIGFAVLVFVLAVQIIRNLSRMVRK